MDGKSKDTYTIPRSYPGTPIPDTDAGGAPSGVLADPVTKDAPSTKEFTPTAAKPMYDFFFSEVFQQLPKLRLAPDLLVYVNRARTITTWTGISFDINDWLVSANGGSGMDRQHMCTLSFYVPRHLETLFIGLGGRFVLRPFHEIEVYAKGRFLVDGKTLATSDAELYGDYLDPSDPDIPTARYYRIYWGYVASITSEWLEGDYQYTIQCAPILRLFDLTHLRQSSTAMSAAGTQTGISAHGNPGMVGNPLQIILAVYNREVGVLEELNTTTFTDGTNNVAPSLRDSNSYRRLAGRAFATWQARLEEVKKRTTFYGLAYRDPVTLELTTDKLDFYKLLSKEAGRDPMSTIPVNVSNGTQVGPYDGSFQDRHMGFSFCLQDFAMANFSPFFPISQFQLFHLNENTKRGEILAQMADLMGYEFYQDLNGNVIFKPPFYNMDVRSDAVFNINDIDILSEQLIEDESQITTTNALVMGSKHDMIQNSMSKDVRPQAQAIDLRLLAKYGQRFKQIELPMLRNPQECYAYAVISMAKENRRFTQINIQIPARPELMLGFPVYLQGRDCFGYLERIQWSYSAGNDFTFSLSLTSVRRRMYMDKSRYKWIMGSRMRDVLKDPSSNEPTPTTEASKTPVQSAEKSNAEPADKPKASDKAVVKTPSNPLNLYTELIRVASSKVGVGGEDTSQDPAVNAFRHAVWGDATKGTEQWCMAFAQYCVAEVANIHDKASTLPVTGGSQDAFNLAVQRFPKYAISASEFMHNSDKASRVGPGWIIIWRHNKPPTPGAGHTSIVQTIHDNRKTCTSIDGNAAGGKVVVNRPRTLPFQPNPNKEYPYDLELVGFIDPWGVGGVKPAAPHALTSDSTSGVPFDSGTLYSRNAASWSSSGAPGRDASKKDLLDLVPLANAVLQTFPPSVKAVEDDTSTEKERGDAEKVAVSEGRGKALDKAAATIQAKEQALLEAQAAFKVAKEAADAKKLQLDTELSDALQYEATLMTATEEQDWGLAPFINLPENQEIGEKYIELRDAAQSAKIAYLNAGFFDGKASKKLMADTLYAEFLKYKDLQVETYKTSLSNDIASKRKLCELFDSSPEGLAKRSSFDTLSKATSELAASRQAYVDTNSIIQMESAGISTNLKNSIQGEGLDTSVDDVLDCDPDMQIFAFGQDTFRTPALKGGVDEKEFKKETVRQTTLNKATFFRPNTFNPYRIVIDARMMGRLAPYSNKDSSMSTNSGNYAKGDLNSIGSQATTGKTSQDAENIIKAREQAVAAAKLAEAKKLDMEKASRTNVVKSSVLDSCQTAYDAALAKYPEEILKLMTSAWASELEATATCSLFLGQISYPPDASAFASITSAQEALLNYVCPSKVAAFKKGWDTTGSFKSPKDPLYDSVLVDYADALLEQANNTVSFYQEFAVAKANLERATKEALEAQLDVTTNQDERYRIDAAASSASRKATALSRNVTANAAPISATAMTPAEYMARLCFSQPYTDANGFEQIPGFPWGRTADVCQTAASLRLDSTALQFTQMTPHLSSTDTIPSRGGFSLPPLKTAPLDTATYVNSNLTKSSEVQLSASRTDFGGSWRDFAPPPSGSGERVPIDTSTGTRS